MKFPKELMIYILKIKSWDAKRNNLLKKLKFPTNENCYTIPYYKWTVDVTSGPKDSYYKQWYYKPTWIQGIEYSTAYQVSVSLK